MQKIPRIILACISLIIICVICSNIFSTVKEQKALENQKYYQLYSSFYNVREEYRMFIMVNPNKLFENYIEEIFTEDYIKEIKAKFLSKYFGDYKIKVYIVYPSGELPYGWQKSEDNIGSNFDQSVFHRNCICTVTFDFLAVNFKDCTVEYINK